MRINVEPQYCSIDIETRSKIDLKKAGLHRYAEDPSTELLCVAWKLHDEDAVPGLWAPGKSDFEELACLIAETNVIFTAWNAQFEIQNWLYCCARAGFPPIPEERWHCTQGDAAMSAYPLALGKCAKALKLPFDKQKDAAGTRLITKLCKPLKDGTFRKKEDFPEDFRKLYEYCKQDVVAERAIALALPTRVTRFEDTIQRYTWITNGRGVPIDAESVKIISSRLDDHLVTLDEEVQRLTDGRLNSPRQRDALLKDLECNRSAAMAEDARRQGIIDQGGKPGRWLVKDTPGIFLDNLRGETINKILSDPEESKKYSKYDLKMLKLRQDVNHTSTAKFKKILTQLCADNTVKGNLQYHGAAPGRDAARGFQIQNLPRHTDPHPETTIQVFKDFDSRIIDAVIGPLLETASGLIRPMIRAPDGEKLVVSDYGQIEARGTAWLCRDLEVLREFELGVDPYKAQAAKMYGVPIDEVDKEQRQYGKLAVLACGYQGSHTALTQFAEGYGLIIERKEAAKVVKLFRESRPLLVSAWANFAETAIQAVRNPGIHFQVPGCQQAIFRMSLWGHLTLRLPSGRKLWYPDAKVEKVTIPYEDVETGKTKYFETESVTRNHVSVTGHWVREGISGGNLLQNWVQATCRDIMMEAVPRLEKEGYEIVMRVHDEIGCCVPDTPEYNINKMNELMCVKPMWAPGFPIVSDGYESKRYQK